MLQFNICLNIILSFMFLELIFFISSMNINYQSVLLHTGALTMLIDNNGQIRLEKYLTKYWLRQEFFTVDSN